MWNRVKGEHSKGEQSKGEQSKGEQSKGEQSKGEQRHRNTANVYRHQELRLVGVAGKGCVSKYRPSERRRTKFMKRRVVSSIAAASTTAEARIQKYFARGTNLPETWRRVRGRTRSIPKH